MMSRKDVLKMFDQEYFLTKQPICNGRISYHQELASTNDLAKSLAADSNKPATSGTLVLSEFQNAGRGRRKNQWQCPAGKGLLFSLILEPDSAPEHWHKIAMATAAATANLLQTHAQPHTTVGVKWPNDIYLNQKKCAGILIEIENDRVIIGIGINVSTTDFPTEIAHKATSLLLEGITERREDLLAQLISSIIRYSSLIENHFAQVLQEYNHYNLLDQKIITLTSNNIKRIGKMVGFSEQGNLLLDTANGMIELHEGHDIEIV